MFTHPKSTSRMQRTLTPYTGWSKSDTPFVSEFPRLLDALYLQFFFIHVSLALNEVIIKWQFGLVGNDVGRINEVNRRRTRLVLGWVIVAGG